MLLNRIVDGTIDLHVGGVYGRVKVRDIRSGCVTQDVLRLMTVPMIVSH